MQLPKAGEGLAVHHRARRAAGVEVLRYLIVEFQLLMLEGRKQIFDVALHVEERARLRQRVDALRDGVTGSDKTQVSALIVPVAQLLEYLTGLEQPHVRVAAIHVVSHHVQQAGDKRGAQIARLITQRIGDGPRLASAEGLGLRPGDEGDRNALVVAEREHGLANLRILRLVGQRDDCPDKRGQRVGKLVVSVDARQFLQQVNLALHVETPRGNLYAEVTSRSEEHT